MEGISDKTKCMASLAVFRELYNAQKDIYVVISEFIKQIIITQGLKSFELTEISYKLKEVYGFEMPIAVVQTALKKIPFLDKAKTRYTVNSKLNETQNNDFIKKQRDVENKNSEIISNLISFIQEKEKRELDEEEKNIVTKSFCSYIIEETTPNKYAEYISVFILNNKKNNEFTQQLNQIKEGIIIYIGISYNSNMNNIDMIDTGLNIYLEMEILFHMAGYNGVLFQTLFEEFYSIITEINKHSQTKSGKKIVHLKYFTETENEICSYFKQAERIVRNKEILDISKSAMTNIVNGCTEAFEIEEKKNAFFRLLQEKGISRDTYHQYYEEKNRPYNIEDKIFFEDNDFENIEKQKKSLQLLNFINIKRSNINQFLFSRIRHILLSGNSTTLQLSLDPRIKDKGKVPLATSLFFLTNRFWAILNKGLSPNMRLKSFNIITKAQITLASQVNDAIGHRFEEIKDRISKGKIDIETAKRNIASLKQEIINPEDIEDNINQNDYISFLQNDSIEQYIAENELRKEKEIEEKEKLKNALNNIEIEKNRKEVYLNKTIEALLSKENRDNYQIYNTALVEYNNTKDNEINKLIRKYTIKNIWIVIFYSLITALCVCFGVTKSENEWKFLVPIGSVILLAIPFIRPLINHGFIRDAFIYLFKYQKCRKELYTTLEKEYDKSHHPPVLKVLTKEDILDRIEG